MSVPTSEGGTWSWRQGGAGAAEWIFFLKDFLKIFFSVVEDTIPLFHLVIFLWCQGSTQCLTHAGHTLFQEPQPRPLLVDLAG